MMDSRISSIRDRLALSHHEYNIADYKGADFTPTVGSKVCVRLSDAKSFRGVWEHGLIAGYINGANGLQACVLYTERGGLEYEFVATSRLGKWRPIVEKEFLLGSIPKQKIKSKSTPKKGKAMKPKFSWVKHNVLETQRTRVLDEEKGTERIYIFRRLSNSQFLVSIEGYPDAKAVINQSMFSDAWVAKMLYRVQDSGSGVTHDYMFPQYGYEDHILSGETPQAAFAKAAEMLELNVAEDFPSAQLRAGQGVWIKRSRVARIDYHNECLDVQDSE